MKIFNLQVNFTMKKIYLVFMLLIGSSSIRAQHIDVNSHVHDEKVIKSSTTESMPGQSLVKRRATTDRRSSELPLGQGDRHLWDG